MQRRVDGWAAGAAATALTLALVAPTTAGATPTIPTVPVAAPAPVAGGRSVGDSLFPGTGNTGYDVLGYRIALSYAASGSIRATTTITARAGRPLSSFALDLEGLTVDGVRVAGRPAHFRRSGTKLVVTPARPATGRFVTTVRYHGTPTTHVDPDGARDGWVPTRTGATALSEPVGAQTWFPNNNTPRDKASLEVALTVPERLAAASNGVLTSRRTKHGRTTWRWRQRQPVATYLSLVAIGRFDVYRSSVELQHGRRIPSWTFVDPSLGTLAKQRALVGRILAFSEQQYGRYPFDAVGFVAQPKVVDYSLETQTRPFFDRAPDESTMVHELAHQWFGDSVTPRDWGDIWLNEGFATYAEDSWAAEHGGPSVSQAFGQVYDQNAPDAELWKPAPADLGDPADLFADPVYTRGGLTLEALRARIGDRAMRSLLRRWTAQHASGVVRTSQFVALAETVSGQDLDGFFHTWLYVPAKPAGY